MEGWVARASASEGRRSGFAPFWVRSSGVLSVLGLVTKYGAVPYRFHATGSYGAWLWLGFILVFRLSTWNLWLVREGFEVSWEEWVQPRR